MSEQELYITRLKRVGKSLRSKSTESRSQPALFSLKPNGKQKTAFCISSRSPSQSLKPSRSLSQSPKPSRSLSQSPRPSRSPSQSPEPSRSPSQSPKSPRSPSQSPNRQSIIHIPNGWRAVKVRLYRNGDPSFLGCRFPISMAEYPNIEVLLKRLTSSIVCSRDMVSGVKYIFTLNGKLIEDVAAFQEGESYVCSSDMKFCKMDYKRLSKLPTWIRKDWIRKDYCAPKRQKSEPIKCSTVVHKRASESDEKKFLRPRIITVMNGSEIRPRKFIQILLNHKTAPSLDRVMATIDCGLKLNSGTVKRLFRVDGTLITELEDLFNAPAGLFFVFGTDKIEEESFLLTVEEMKKIQSCKKSPLDGCIASAVKLILLKRSKSYFGSATKNSMCSSFDAQLCKSLSQNSSQEGSPMSPGCASARQGLEVPGNPELEPLLSKYTIGNILGEGNFAVVKECFDRSTSHQYTLKIINRSKCVGYEIPIENEVSILSQMNKHPRVIQVFDIISSPSALYLVMELVHGGNLFDFILGSTTYTEKVVSGMCFHLASALHYVHSLNIVHRDVKPENLLVKDDGNGQKTLKLGDFGLASRYALPLYTVCGTPSYMAPEIITQVGYGPRVDIWSAGVIMYLLLSGRPPFVGEDLSNLFANITCGKYNLTGEPWNKISASAKDLLQTLLELDPVRRISAFEFMNNSWVADDMNCKSENILPIIAPKIEKFLRSNKKSYRMPRGASIVARTALDKSSNFFVIKTPITGTDRPRHPLNLNSA